MTPAQFNTTNLSQLMSFENFIRLSLAYENYMQKNYSSVPANYRGDVKKLVKGTKPSNTLTNCIIKFIIWSGYQAERINTTGIMRNGKWTVSGGTKGSADISAIIKNKDGIGITVKIEVKIHDRQSEAQKAYENNVILAGGKYWLVRSFDEFIINFDKIIQL